MNSDFNSVDPSTSLKDFQAFIGEILKEENEKSLTGVRALTHGLGLESPKPSVTAPAIPPKVEASKVAVSPKPTPKPVERPQVSQRASYQQDLVNLVSPPQPVVSKPAPPPLPSVSLVKRASSLVLDQVFVQTLWVIALVITSNIFSGFETGLSSGVFRGFSDPLFFRFAILEFATLWLGYLAISLGIFNMTFGMWVWGIRISYGDRRDENYGLRKLMRIFWSFVFYAPILPSAILAIKRNDRNALDILSGSNLYLVQ